MGRASERIASIVEDALEHHNTLVEVLDHDAGCRVARTADLLPHELGETVAAILERGLDLTKRTHEAALS